MKEKEIKIFDEEIKKYAERVSVVQKKNSLDYLNDLTDRMELSDELYKITLPKEGCDHLINYWTEFSKKWLKDDKTADYYKQELIKEYNAFFPKKETCSNVISYLKDLSMRAFNLTIKMKKMNNEIKENVLLSTILRYIKYNFKDGKKYKKKDITKLIKSYSAGSAIEEEFQESIEGLLDKKIVITGKEELSNKIKSLIRDYVSKTGEYTLYFPYGDYEIFEGDYKWYIENSEPDKSSDDTLFGILEKNMSIYNNSFEELKDFIKKEFDDSRVYPEGEYQKKMSEKAKSLEKKYTGRYMWAKSAKFARDIYFSRMGELEYGKIRGSELKNKLLKYVDKAEAEVNRIIDNVEGKGRKMERLLKKYVLRYALYQYDKLYREKGKKKWSKGEIIKLLTSYTPASREEEEFSKWAGAYLESRGSLKNAKSRKTFMDVIDNDVINTYIYLKVRNEDMETDLNLVGDVIAEKMSSLKDSLGKLFSAFDN